MKRDTTSCQIKGKPKSVFARCWATRSRQKHCVLKQILQICCHSPSGSKHFLLMCNVKAEDAGEIRFVARDIESTAYLEVEGKLIFTAKISYLFLLFDVLTA